jgi:hypothetical protein
VAKTNSSDEGNGSFAPIRPNLLETEPGFESADEGVEATERDGHRRKPSAVSEPLQRSLAERIRTSAKG